MRAFRARMERPSERELIKSSREYGRALSGGIFVLDSLRPGSMRPARARPGSLPNDSTCASRNFPPHPHSPQQLYPFLFSNLFKQQSRRKPQRSKIQTNQSINIRLPPRIIPRTHPPGSQPSSRYIFRSKYQDHIQYPMTNHPVRRS